MKIEHSFTEAAKQILAEEKENLGKGLEEEAINEAFRSRGKPIEVTSSDVLRAREHFRKKKDDLAQLGFPSTSRVLQGYFWLGIAILVATAIVLLLEPFYPILETVVGRDSERFPILISAGLGLLLFGIFGRRFILWRIRRRKED